MNFQRRKLDIFITPGLTSFRRVSPPYFPLSRHGNTGSYWGDENNVIWRVCFSAGICSGFGATLKSSFFPHCPVLKGRAIPAQGPGPGVPASFVPPSPEGARHKAPSFDSIVCRAPSGLWRTRIDRKPRPATWAGMACAFSAHGPNARNKNRMKFRG